ncbi:MAG: cation-transporting P-type ATPase [Actinobacteria bacterium]|nr:cation-transporting P-type ATPase [Actinomycetota bacterium]
MVNIIHSAVRGRVRCKIEGLYHSEPLKRYIEFRLKDNNGISRVSASELTGKVLVLYNPEHSHRQIASYIKTIVSDFRKLQARAARTQPRTRTGESPSRKDKLLKLLLGAEEQRDEPWHLMKKADVLQLFGADKRTGLTSDEARKLFHKHGPNVLPESLPRPRLGIFLDQFKSFPVALLGVAAGVSVLTGGMADALVILGVVALNALIGYVTESQAERTIYSLKRLANPSALVIRDAKQTELHAEEVIPGDILVLKPGSYVAADARLINAEHLSADESALTGESMPAAKITTVVPIRQKAVPANRHALSNTGNNVGSGIPLADRSNMVYMGTLITGGQGLAVAVATGGHTEIGKIQALAQEVKAPETPIERQLSTIGTQLALLSGAICAGVFVLGIQTYGALQMLKTSISLAVAAVPEGLPTVAVTTLALGVRNMRSHKAIIRRLDVVETLGSVQTICLDKTGTLTENKMSVVSVFAGMRRMRVSNGALSSNGESICVRGQRELLHLVQVSALCNESRVSKEGGDTVVSGTPTENSLVYLAMNVNVDVVRLRKRLPAKKIIYRSETRNFMVTVHKARGARQTTVAVKGSPTEVLSRCAWYMKDGVKLALSDEERLVITVENERMSGAALRVLGMAYATYNGEFSYGEDVGDIARDLVWLGLVGMADPIREGVKEAIGMFHRAGIDTVMITGDQSLTAYAVAKKLRLNGGEQIEILDSTRIDEIDPAVLSALADKVRVFARVSPAHKLQIVQAMQGAGKVVAMTGDGINDAPALKAADIGIAMGHTGTDVAREVADVVLEDDRLETMIIAVSQGRTIYSNIRKSIRFLLATNLSEIFVTFLALVARLGQPLSAMQLLWINLMSDVAPGIALALESPEPDVLDKPPRDPNEPLLKRSDMRRIFFESAVLSIGALGAYGYGIARYGIGGLASTLAFMSLTTGQLLHAISSRSETHSIFDRFEADGVSPLQPNRYLNGALAGSLVLQALTLLTPGLRSLLGITRMSAVDGAVVLSSALLPLAVNEGTKRLGDKGRAGMVPVVKKTPSRLQGRVLSPA